MNKIVQNYWINKKQGRYFKEIKGMPRKLCICQVDGTASGMLVFDSEEDARSKGWEKVESVKDFLIEQAVRHIEG